MIDNNTTALTVPERTIPVPKHLSSKAQAMLAPFPGIGEMQYPNIDDIEGWRKHVEMVDNSLFPMLQAVTPPGEVDVETRIIDGLTVFIITPEGIKSDDRTVMLDMHGGGLILCGGELGLELAKAMAITYKVTVWSVDFRMAPDHPFPASLEDGQEAYKALLAERKPSEIVFHGASGGGNLIAAMLLKSRDENMPLPAAIILQTPEVDLTETGDTFHTNVGIDNGLTSLMPVNLMYANGEDLEHPYISPLFGDFKKGFPPTLLTSGTRDLFLSNTVRMHRALRAADIEAELHIMEAGPHGNLSTSDESEAIDKDIRRFIQAHVS